MLGTLFSVFRLRADYTLGILFSVFLFRANHVF